MRPWRSLAGAAKELGWNVRLARRLGSVNLDTSAIALAIYVVYHSVSFGHHIAAVTEYQ
jgi:hypothetical protein